MASSTPLMAQVHTIIRRTIHQYYVNQAVKQGHPREQVQAGSITFVQRFGSSLNLNLHYHFIFLEGVYLDRSAQGLKPKFVKLSAPSEASIAAVVTKISQRVIRKLRQLGYLEPDLDTTVATGYDPLVNDDPKWTRTLSASVQQRIAFGERAGQRLRRIGSGFGSEGERPTLSGPRCTSVHGFSLHANNHIPAHRRDQLERLIRYTASGAVSLERLAQDEGGDLIYTLTRAWSDGTRGIPLSPLELLEKLAALIPPPRVHQVRYGGCLAAHSTLRGAITPTPRQQGIETVARPVSSRWGWARLLKRVVAIDLERCPRCQSGALRMIAAITSRPVIRRILRPLKLAADPPPRAPARLEPGRFAWVSASINSLGPGFRVPSQAEVRPLGRDAHDRLTRRVTLRGLRGTDGAAAHLTPGGSRP
jgi:Putative transposase